MRSRTDVANATAPRLLLRICTCVGASFAFLFLFWLTAGSAQADAPSGHPSNAGSSPGLLHSAPQALAIHAAHPQGDRPQTVGGRRSTAPRPVADLVRPAAERAARAVAPTAPVVSHVTDAVRRTVPALTAEVVRTAGRTVRSTPAAPLADLLGDSLDTATTTTLEDPRRPVAHPRAPGRTHQTIRHPGTGHHPALRTSATALPSPDSADHSLGTAPSPSPAPPAPGQAPLAPASSTSSSGGGDPSSELLVEAGKPAEVGLTTLPAGARSSATDGPCFSPGSRPD